jgi:hypothetical protein
MTLRQNTIGRPQKTKLWWLDRDDTTIYWSWVKVTSINDADSYKEQGRWLKPVTMQFYMAEGVWYGETEQTQTLTGTGGGPGSGGFSVVTGSTVGGAYKAVTAEVSATGATAIDNIKLTTNDPNAPSALTSWVVTYADSPGISGSNYLIINSAEMSAQINDGVGNLTDAYSAVTRASGQVAFLLFPPTVATSLSRFFGIQDVTSGADYSVIFKWYNTYVF